MARTLLINYGVNTGGINMNNAKILTVDDQPEDLDIVNHILRRDEYDVVSANNGLEAINMLDNNPDISIIILDRMMPIMDGLSFMHRIRQIEEYNNIPVIMQTAAGDDHEIAEGIESGVYWYITKPFSHKLLSSIVKSALRVCRKHQKFSEITDFYINRRKKVKGGMARMQKCSFNFNSLKDASNVANALACIFPEPKNMVGPCIELLVNAVEHGNLGITFEEKSKLLLEGKWLEEIEYRQSLSKNLKKKVTVDVLTDNSDIYLTIKDDGAGFNWEPYMDLDCSRAHMANGRGIYLAGLGFDEVSYKGRGNKVVCRKSLN